MGAVAEETVVAEVVETPAEVVETETPVEEVSAEVEGEVAEVAEETAEEVAEAVESDETPVEAAEAAPELPVFEGDAPTIVTQAKEIFEKYEFPPDAQAAIDALVAQTQNDPMAEYSVYGTVDDVKTLLDRQALLDSVTEIEPGRYRPNTDKYVAEIAAKDALVADYLRFDLNSLPSTKYQGITKFEESIADALYVEGDTVATVLERYNTMMTHMKSGVIPASDVPEFVPVQLKEAYYRLSKQTRNELAELDPEFDEDRDTITQKLAELQLIQRGIDSEKDTTIKTAKDQATAQQDFAQAVQAKQEAFADSFRDTFAKDLAKTVTFSPDAKTNKVLAYQQVAMFEKALEVGGGGEWARAVLSEAGVNVDVNKAQQLAKAIEKASVSVTTYERQKAEDGTPYNKIELNKATKEFENAVRDFRAFGKDIIDQAAKFTAGGTAEAVKAEVAKIKVMPKGRPAGNGVNSPVKKTAETLPPYGTPEWDRHWAQKTIREQAARAQAYQS